MVMFVILKQDCFWMQTKILSFDFSGTHPSLVTNLGDSPTFESVSSLVKLVNMVTVLAWLAGLNQRRDCY